MLMVSISSIEWRLLHSALKRNVTNSFDYFSLYFFFRYTQDQQARDKRMADETRDKRMAEEARDRRIAEEMRGRRMADEMRDRRMVEEMRDRRMAEEIRDRQMAEEMQRYSEAPQPMRSYQPIPSHYDQERHLNQQRQQQVRDDQLLARQVARDEARKAGVRLPPEGKGYGAPGPYWHGSM